MVAHVGVCRVQVGVPFNQVMYCSLPLVNTPSISERRKLDPQVPEAVEKAIAAFVIKKKETTAAKQKANAKSNPLKACQPGGEASGKPPAAQSLLPRLFDKGKQREVDRAWAQFFISSGVSFRIIDDPAFRKALSLTQALPQGYKPPGRKRLASDLLDAEYEAQVSFVHGQLKEAQARPRHGWPTRRIGRPAPRRTRTSRRSYGFVRSTAA